MKKLNFNLITVAPLVETNKGSLNVSGTLSGIPSFNYRFPRYNLYPLYYVDKSYDLDSPILLKARPGNTNKNTEGEAPNEIKFLSSTEQDYNQKAYGKHCYIIVGILDGKIEHGPITKEQYLKISNSTKEKKLLEE
jgi:hypothetical protein